MSSRLLQWYNQNMHRAYPLVQGTSARLPDAFITDIRIYTRGTSATFYISRVVSTGARLTVFIGISKQVQGQTINIPQVLQVSDVPTDIDISRGPVTIYPVYPISTFANTEQYKDIQGSITFGTTRMYTRPTDIQFTSSQCIVDPICISSGDTQGIDAIIVGDKRLTGDVTLKAGAGIDISVDQATNTILISQSQSMAQDAADLIRAQLGTPVTSINGIKPDDQGTITLKGLDCTTIQNIGNAIVLSNPCSKPCCGDQNASDTAAALKVVQQSIAVLNNYYTSVSTAVNIMASRLSMVINRGAPWQSS